MNPLPQREVLADGTIVLKSKTCSFHYTRPRPGLVVLTVAGRDLGDLGLLPMEELRKDLHHGVPLEVFIDALGLTGAVVPAQKDWAAWLLGNRSALKAVRMLVHGSYMHFTAQVVAFLSRTGELLRVYLDADAFRAALHEATARPARWRF